MLRKFSIVMGAMLLAGCSLVGIRSGTEQPSYTVADRLGESVEIRRYAPRLAAQVTVPAENEGDARGQAFRILAGYIFGKNAPSDEIAMTAPVEVERGSREIAMTAPVETVETANQQMRMRFFLPAKYTRETTPKPLDERIELVTIPAQTMAVLRFTGARDGAAVVKKEKALLDRLADSSWTAAGEPVAYFYDPPWTIPFLRRNEVAVPVERP